MEEMRKDVQAIRESQIRMEENVRYHIKRTDLLEEKVEGIEKDIKPIYVIHFFKENYKFLLFLVGVVGLSITTYIKYGGV